MFFRKAKRIKELEAENDALKHEINFLRLKERINFQREDLNVVKYQKTESFPVFIDPNIAEEYVKRDLCKGLYPLISIATSEDFTPGYYFIKASIRVVKEVNNEQS